MQPRDEALRFLAQASVLVTLHQDSNLAVPGKVFDYMRFNAWVLALTERGSATAEVLTQTAADIVLPADVDGLAAVLKERYLQFSSGVRPGRIIQDDRFSRREQTNRLLSAIETLPRTA